jgi:hypothetical protein
MSDSEIQELKDRLDALVKQHGKIYDRLTRIDTLLEERCASRGRTLENVKEKVDRLRLAQAKIVAAATALSVAAGYILKGLGFK